MRGTLAGPVMMRSRLGVDGAVYVATSSCDDEGLGSSSISERVYASEAPRHGRCAELLSSGEVFFSSEPKNSSTSSTVSSPSGREISAYGADVAELTSTTGNDGPNEMRSQLFCMGVKARESDESCCDRSSIPRPAGDASFAA